MKKIAVIGTHCVGKTTLCKSIVDYAIANQKDAYCVEEVVRECPYPINQKHTIDAVEWIMFHQILQEVAAKQRGHDLVVCDRSALDPICYYEATNEKDPKDIPKHWALRHLAHAHIKEYDAIFLIMPNQEEVEFDGFRDTDLKFREKVHGIFEAELEDMSEQHPFPVDDLSELPLYMLSSGQIFGGYSRTTKWVYNKCFP